MYLFWWSVFGSLGNGYIYLMIELEVIFFLVNQVLTFYLANYSQETVVFVLVLSILHFVGRLSKSRRGVLD